MIYDAQSPAHASVDSDGTAAASSRLCMHPYDRAFRLVLPAGAVAVLATVLAVGWYTQPDRLAHGYARAADTVFPSAPCRHAEDAVRVLPHRGGPLPRRRDSGRRGVHRLSQGHSHRPAGHPETDTNLQRGTSLALAARPHAARPCLLDHRPHVNAGIVCQTCHGEVQTMTVIVRQMGMRMGDGSGAIAIRGQRSRRAPRL